MEPSIMFIALCEPWLMRGVHSYLIVSINQICPVLMEPSIIFIALCEPWLVRGSDKIR